MPINEALFAAMKAASYIKPNAGKSYKLQRVAEELIAKQAPANPKCRVEDAFAPMADGYAVPLRVFTPLVAYGAPLPETLEESSANGTPVASAISAILPAVLPKVLPKILIKESTSSGNADENDNLGLDLAVQRDGNGVGTGNLDGLTELDALAVDVHTELSLDGVSDHSGGNGAKEDALVADLDVNGDRLALEGSLGLVGGKAGRRPLLREC